LAVLQRGYSITQDARTGAVVRSAGELQIGQTIVTRLSRGQATSKVETIENAPPD
jgi:exonuclease VII large subunit